MIEFGYLVFLLTFAVLLVVIPLALVVHAVYLQWYEVPFVPTRKKEMEIILRYIKAGESKRVLDLGSGTGDVLLAFAKRGSFVHGIEANPVLALVSKLRLKMAGVSSKKYSVVVGDFFKKQFPRVDVVILYLSTSENIKLRVKLEKELPGALVVVNRFPLNEWKPLYSEGRVSIYRVPEAS